MAAALVRAQEAAGRGSRCLKVAGSSEAGPGRGRRAGRRTRVCRAAQLGHSCPRLFSPAEGPSPARRAHRKYENEYASVCAWPGTLRWTPEADTL